MDKDENTKVENFSFAELHKEWYEKTYTGGIDFTREKLQEYAEFMTTDAAAMDQLSPTAKTQIEGLANGSKLEEYCPDTPRNW